MSVSSSISVCLNLQKKPICFAADEFSRVLEGMHNNKRLSDNQRRTAISNLTQSIYTRHSSLIISDFEVRSENLICGASNRPVQNFWLPPANETTRDQYLPLIHQLMDFYKSRPFLFTV